MRTLTPSAIAAFVNCPYRYQLGYLYKIYPIAYSPSLTIGRGLKAGIGNLHTSTRRDPLPDAMLRARAAMKTDLIKLRKLMDVDEWDEVYQQALRDRAKVTALLRAYQEVYPRSLPMEQIKCRFEPRPIINPATGRDSRTFNLASVFDGWYRLEDGRVMVYDLVATSVSLKEATQLVAHSIQPQLHLSMMRPDVEIAGICIDIVKKPVAQFKKALSRAKKKKPVEVLVEPLQDYEDRCYNGYIQQPARFFQRIMLPRRPQRIRDAQAVAWRVAQEIRDSDRHGYLGCRGINCKTPRGWCDFRSLCWYDHTENYRHGDYAHDELELAA